MSSTVTWTAVSLATTGSRRTARRSTRWASSNSTRRRGKRPGGCWPCPRIRPSSRLKTYKGNATEMKAHELVDAIVDITETGSSLRANKLRIVDTLLSSTPRLIANHAAWKDSWKRQKIETLALLLKGALEAETKVGLKMNIAQKNLARLLQTLPALRNPTISNLSLEGWVAVETIIDEHIVRELIPALKAAGAEGIIEYPLNKVVY
jgi:ATP phosphoribosyltransferase